MYVMCMRILKEKAVKIVWKKGFCRSCLKKSAHAELVHFWCVYRRLVLLYNIINTLFF